MFYRPLLYWFVIFMFMHLYVHMYDASTLWLAPNRRASLEGACKGYTKLNEVQVHSHVYNKRCVQYYE